MSLKSFKPEWAEVKSGEKGEGFRVRGLSLADLSSLVRTHLPDLQQAFATYEAAQNDGSSADSLVLKLVQDAPVLTSHVIALASGEEDTAEQAKLLPFPVQVDALVKAMNLTFVAVGGSKNFGAMLLKLVSGLGMKIPDGLTKPLAMITKSAL